LFRLLNFSSRGTDEAGSTRLAIVHTLCRVVACVANDAAAFLVEITGVARAIVASGTVRYFYSTLSAVSSVLALQVDVAFGVWTVEASWANNRILRLVRTVRALGTGLGRGGADRTEGSLSTGDGVRACPWAVASCGAVETRALSRLGELWLISAFGTLGSLVSLPFGTVVTWWALPVIEIGNTCLTAEVARRAIGAVPSGSGHVVCALAEHAVRTSIAINDIVSIVGASVAASKERIIGGGALSAFTIRLSLGLVIVYGAFSVSVGTFGTWQRLVPVLGSVEFVVVGVGLAVVALWTHVLGKTVVEAASRALLAVVGRGGSPEVDDSVLVAHRGN